MHWFGLRGTQVLPGMKGRILSKNVSESDLYIEWIAVEDICSYYNKFSTQKPNENFRNSKYLEILGDLPSILSLAPWLKNRSEDIIITRILTRMLITPALLHRFGLYPFCSVCNQENTIEHILSICKKYLSHRRIFCLKLNMTRRGHDLGNSIRDETWHISSIPLGCSPINLRKCNGKPIRRKWPSNFGHNLYTSNCSREISAQIAQMSAHSLIIRKVRSSVLAEVSIFLFFSKLFQIKLKIRKIF
ncbi:hypothetical protein AVEN_84451-1 [Araneus ventricosus]|uniref:Reverse transcriptase zinc-binding domain-containing protein n=1 Tax=Araneus ventricosus TaxID=182803 RepID=A0A4Y2S0X5_ARAVE|nr:hypothetical protein AVEN_84451-1 [Araneus ventricosus]